MVPYNITLENKTVLVTGAAGFMGHSFFLGDEYSSASQLLESSIKATIDDTETIKSVCYGRFKANIPFDNSCDETTLQSLNTVIRQLTYKELCLIRLLYHRERVSTNSLEAYLRNTDDIEGTVLFNQLLHLQNLGILITLPPFHVGTALGNVRISILGMRLYEMMELDLISEENLSSLKAVISKVG